MNAQSLHCSFCILTARLVKETYRGRDNEIQEPSMQNSIR